MFFVFFICSNHLAHAQNFEYGFLLGSVHYFGDLNTGIGIKNARPCGGLILRNNISPYFAYRGTLIAGAMSGTDNNASSIYQSTRDLDFKSTFGELAAQLEINFFQYIKDDVEHRFTPYITAGLGAIYTKPNPLHTEKKYSAIQPVVPFGAGLKFNFNFFWNLVIEASNRATFTDYLDDVSTTYATASNPFGVGGKQRGDSQRNDRYLIISFSLTHNFRKTSCPEISKNPYIW